MPSTSKARAATLFALAAIALWSLLAALAERLRGMPPFFLVGVSLLLGGLVGLPFGARAAVQPRAVALGVYGFFAYHFCFFLGLRFAPVVQANLVNYLWPLLLVVLSPLLVRGAALRARHIAGAVLGFAGTVSLVGFGQGGLAAGLSGREALGYVLSFLAAVIWSTYSLLTRRLGAAAGGATSVSCLISGALALGCHFAFEPHYAPSSDEWPLLLLIGAGPMGAAFHLWERAMRDGDPRAIGTLAYLDPLLSTLVIVATVGGRITPATLLGGGLIVGGGAVGSWSRRPSPL